MVAPTASDGPPSADAVRYQRVALDTPAYEACLALRRRWLRTPLGLDFSPGDLEDDRNAEHVAALAGHRVVGCVIGVHRMAGIQIRQLVVNDGHRNRGLARGLMGFLEAFFIDRPPAVPLLFLNARADAIPFYAKLGYHPAGPPFLELSIVHQRMEKPIGPPSAGSSVG